MGLGAEVVGSCGHCLRENLFQALEKDFAGVFALNGAAKDLETERAQHEEFIKKHGPIT